MTPAPPDGHALRPFPRAAVELLGGPLLQRRGLVRDYLVSLDSRKLLQNHYMEAMLWPTTERPEDLHWGIENPATVVRGHFLGHWLSAAARLVASTGDLEVKGKADWIVGELRRCQEANGGRWLGPIPEKYLHWMAQGRQLWAAQYVVHKTLMGLFDMFSLTGNELALELLIDAADWFHEWTAPFSTEQMDDILDQETGGMLEVWADLLAVTGREEHLDLVHRYDRRRLFDRLLAGEDVLTNRHMNTTVPEAYGAARAFEVTGEQRYRDVAEAYWDCAVTKRGFFCTGGQSCHELYTPPFELAARVSASNQEHCTTYNMMRLADYLLRWTGDAAYADYWERNLYNGTLAQQHPKTGMVTYFLPLDAGSKKKWGSREKDFWCCHGTLVQAGAQHGTSIWFEHDAGVALAQYVPSTTTWRHSGAIVRLTQQTIVGPGGTSAGPTSRKDVRHPSVVHRPEALQVRLRVEADRATTAAIDVRIPWWITGPATIRIGDETVPVTAGAGSFQRIERTWHDDLVEIDLPRKVTTCPLPDEPGTVAFMEGPVVLAGLCEREQTLAGDPQDATTMLAPHAEIDFAWRSAYRTRGQERGVRFIPLHEVTDETYTVYFPVQPRA